jgi:hypothetical protein
VPRRGRCAACKTVFDPDLEQGGNINVMVRRNPAVDLVCAGRCLSCVLGIGEPHTPVLMRLGGTQGLPGPRHSQSASSCEARGAFHEHVSGDHEDQTGEGDVERTLAAGKPAGDDGAKQAASDAAGDEDKGQRPVDIA